MVKLLAFQPGPMVVYGKGPLQSEKPLLKNTFGSNYDLYGLSDTDWLVDYLHSVTST